MVAIDGKTVRGPRKEGNKSAIHMVSAFAAANGLVLGRAKTNQESDEITTIPELLKALDIGGCIITVDAMGCQAKIASEIVEKGAGYILAAKDNQNHWVTWYVPIGGIENKLHWQLDVSFGEDKSRKRDRNAAENYSVILRMALNIIKNENPSKRGVKGKRLKAGWDNQYLMKLLVF